MNAFVLVNSRLGFEEEVETTALRIDGVKQIHKTFGAWDMVVYIEGENAEELRKITHAVRKIDRVQSTLTLTGVEKSG